MDIFESQYYKACTFFLKSQCLWPYQSRLLRRIYLLFWYAVQLSLFIPMTNALLQAWKRKIYYIAAENIFLVIFMLTSIMKFTSAHFSGAQLRTLMNKIARDWQTITDEEEREILKRYSGIGFKLSRAYRVYLYTVVMLSYVLPFSSYFLDFAFPLQNGTHPKHKIYDLNYGFFDENEHFLWVCMHQHVVSFMTICYLNGIDSFFILSVHHICGLFAITSHRLLMLEKNYSKRVSESVPDKETLVHQNLVKAIILHRESISACTLLEDCFSITFLIENHITMIGTNLCVIHIVYLTNSVFYYLKSISIFFGVSIHLFSINYTGQQIIDNSADVFDAVYFSNWYTYSPKTQKLLKLIMVRSLTPCELTAGKISNLSYFTFVKWLRTTTSLFTVLLSVF